MIPFPDLEAKYRQIKPQIDAGIRRVVDRAQFVLEADVEAFDGRLPRIAMRAIALRSTARHPPFTWRFSRPGLLPLLDEDEAKVAPEVVPAGWVSQRPQVAAFECESAAVVGAAHASAVSNCTFALHLALTALNIAPSEEVIAADHSFIATAHCIRYCGADPVLVDIESATYNIDPAALTEAVAPRRVAILAVHQMDMPWDVGALTALVMQHDLAPVEDAASAVGRQLRVGDRWDWNGKPDGGITFFSFHPRKVITTGRAAC